jgi:GT2 family glycosyltransferase
MRALVSVIVPTFNRAWCIGRAIDSALQQTHRDFEVIIVDDGSSDGTRELIEKKYRDIKSIKYIYQTNSGVASSRNVALKLANGEFIAFLDSDDIWKPWKVELQLECMKKLPHIGMIWSDMEALGPDGSIVSSRYIRTMYTAYRRFPIDVLFAEHYTLPNISVAPESELAHSTLYAGDIFSPMVTGNLVHTSTAMLRRDRADQVGGFDEQLQHSGEDYDFHLRTCREGPVGFINLSTILYQTGLPDQLVGRSYFMAQNFLTTLSRTLERDQKRIALAPRIIDEILAEANAWVAEVLISRGDPRAAERYLKCNLRHKPWQPRALAQLALCQVPLEVAELCRRAYRNLSRHRTPSGRGRN